MSFDSLTSLESHLKIELDTLKALDRYRVAGTTSLVSKGARRVFTSEGVMKLLAADTQSEAVDSGRLRTADYLDGHDVRIFWFGTLVEEDADLIGLTYRLDPPL